MEEKEISIKSCPKCDMLYPQHTDRCCLCKSELFQSKIKIDQEKLACPYCKSEEILFSGKIGTWSCPDCLGKWKKFEPGMEFKIGIYCKWGLYKKWDARLPENQMHGELWCHRPKNYPFQTCKPFTCRCEAFEHYLSDLVDWGDFWDIIDGIWWPPAQEDVEDWKKEFNVCGECGDLAFHSDNSKYFCNYHWNKYHGGNQHWV